MGHIEEIFLWFAALAVVLVVLGTQRRLLDAVIEAIDKFRGGPPSAMHPCPSNDAALLRRRGRKIVY